jgi:hypothetical protein
VCEKHVAALGALAVFSDFMFTKQKSHESEGEREGV